MPATRDRPSLADDSATSTTESRTAIDKACELLETFPGGGKTVGVTELARDLGLSKSTAFRLLSILERNGFVERHHGRYRLGRRLFDLGARVYEVSPGILQDALAPFMAALFESTRHTVNLGVLHDTEVVLLSRLHGQRSMPHVVRVGSRFPSHGSSMGKALLARSPEVVEELLSGGLNPLTPHTIVDADAFRAHLEQTRRLGIATSHQEARPNLNCISVALLDGAGRPLAALGLSGLSVTFDARAQGTLRSVAADAERVLRQVITRQRPS